MRIALYNLTNTTKYGGVESFVWDLANQLVHRGHAVTVIGGDGQIREAAPGVHVQTFPYIDRDRFRWIPGLQRAYAERKLLERLSMAHRAIWYLIQQRFDIIHIQKPYDLLPALIAARCSGAKVILGCHGEDYYPGDRWLARYVDGAVSCSQYNAQTVKNRYPIAIDVVYNGIDTALFHPPVPPPSLADQPVKLLFVGRLQPWKGVDTAIRAVAQVPEATLTIAGDGGDRLRLEALTSQLALHDRVTFLGSVPRQDIAQLLPQFHALVATSFASETFGIGLVEAQACGVPVLASRFGGFVEVVAEGRTGYFFTPQHADELAQLIRTLLHNPAVRHTFAAAAPAWAQQFAWPAVTDRVEQVYTAVMARG